jgi:hypothetical protein
LGAGKIGCCGEHRQSNASADENAVSANTAWRPYQLFSHSDQVQQQQSSRSDTPSSIGWAGKIADRTNTINNPGGQIPMITSIAGTQLFTLGRTTTPLAIRNAVTPAQSNAHFECHNRH